MTYNHNKRDDVSRSRQVARQLGLATLLCLAALGPARAEKADSYKETVIEFDRGSDENVKLTRTLTGNVVLTKGTLVMKAGRAVITEDPQGYQFVIFWADGGKLATFRQKRDGGEDLWMEGEAERIEYNNKDEVVKLFSKAKVTQLEGKRITDQADGPFISYDSRAEVFTQENTASGESKVGAGRSRMVIQSKNVPPPPAPPAKPGAPAPAKPGAAGAPAAKPATPSTMAPMPAAGAAAPGKE